MATVLLPFPKFKAVDSAGAALSGGRLYSYEAGTTTPKATYTDTTGATPNANPVILDAAGEADVYLATDSAYKFVLKDSSDVTQWTVDDVAGFLTVDRVASTSASGIVELATQAETEARTDATRAATPDSLDGFALANKSQDYTGVNPSNSDIAKPRAEKGVVTLTYGGSFSFTYRAVTFQVAFSAAPTVLLTLKNETGLTTAQQAGTNISTEGTESTTGFTVYHRTGDATNPDNGDTANIAWLAIGPA